MVTAQGTESLIQPGEDTGGFDKELQNEVAQALGVPQEEVIPPFSQKVLPESEEILGDLQEELQALNPLEEAFIRTAPNTTKSKRGWRDILMERLKHLNPWKRA